MGKTGTFNRALLIFGIPLGLLGALVLIMKSSFLETSDILDLAITLDLLLIVPLVYFLLIRKSAIPKITVIPIMIIGLVIGSYFLPEENQNYLNLFKIWGLPVIEFSILTLIILKIRKAIQIFKKERVETPDFYDTLKNVCTQILPKKVALVFATEIAVFYYSFIVWKKRINNDTEFLYHKKSGTPQLLVGLIMAIIIETCAMHFLLESWSPVAAWIFTSLSIYTAIQVLGIAKSLSRRPIIIRDDKLILRYGIMNDTEIKLSDIDSIILSKKEFGKDKLNRTLSPLGALEGHNVIITLSKENELFGLYGIRKKFRQIGLHIDEPDKFKEVVENLRFNEQ